MATPALDVGYRPREQFLTLHARRQRWGCVVTHVRAGKTVACLMDLVDAALRCTHDEPRFAYVAPFYRQAKDVAWAYLKKFTASIPGIEQNESELRIDLPNKGRVRLYGADNYDAMRGIYLDGVVLDEYADFHPSAWPEVIRPRLSDRRGWGVFIGTPKGRNAFWEKWQEAVTNPEEWFSLMLRASETGILSAEELADAAKAMTAEQYAQEYECSFDAAIIGAYYGKEIADAERAGQVCSVPYDPALPVYTAWDLGIGDSTAIWMFQAAHDGLRVINHYENHGQSLAHYASWLSSTGYRIAADYVPHDAMVRELGTGRTRVETLKSLGRKPRLVPNHRIEDGINAMRVSFPRIWFDAGKCAKGLEALRQYRADFDAKGKVFRNAPKHDWTSHTADAARYMAMAWKELRAEPVKIARPTHLVLEAQPDGRIRSNMSVKDIIEMKRRKRTANG